MVYVVLQGLPAHLLTTEGTAINTANTAIAKIATVAGDKAVPNAWGQRLHHANGSNHSSHKQQLGSHASHASNTSSASLNGHAKHATPAADGVQSSAYATELQVLTIRYKHLLITILHVLVYAESKHSSP